MRSRRSRFEYACRVGAFAVLGWLLGLSVIPSAPRGVDRANGSELGARLAGWTREPGSLALHADLTATPDAWIVDWLAALEHAGHAVSWSGSPPAVAMSVEALADPNGGVRVDVAAPRGAVVRLRDDVGAIDSVRVAGAGASAVAPVAVGRVTGMTGAQRFGVAAPDSAHLRAIVVVGAAGWEGKFVVSALEERGWPVIARFSVAPAVEVTEGQLALDTSRVAAVVAIDTTIGRLGAAVERFVRSGGGLVLAGMSGSASSVASLAPGTSGTRLRPAIEPADTIGLGSTGYYPVSMVRQDAVVLDRRAAGVAVAARRIGAGRVMQVGFDDSWRWRMAGAPGSENAHREWWSRVVGSVAYVPAGRTPPHESESAPLARLVDRLGPAREMAGSSARHVLVDPQLLMTLLVLCLLAEWTSRRMRGLK